MTKDNPFPGMNPFLEAFWPDVDTRLIGYIADDLAEQLPTGLKARSEEQVTLASENEPEGRQVRADVAVVESWKQGIPPAWQPEDKAGGGTLTASEPLYCLDEEQTDRWVEITDRHGRLVTVIEVLSPANKGADREKYRAKRQAYIDGGVSVVEIDLLRGGHHTVNVPRGSLRDPEVTYLTCVTRSSNIARKEYYLMPLTQALPAIRIPLRHDDPDAVLALQPLIDRCYRKGGYWQESHTRLPGPPLSGNDDAWVTERLKAAGFTA
ncbi:MAG: DUF4058 family protein [Verrucomicrobiaceae bacterium]|nr:DUF4058 family protein [Verrucomicrobiaceae bacterium]